MDNVHDYLKSLGIVYEAHEHVAVFTVEEAEHIKIDTKFGDNKNLFLKNRKGTKYYLVTLGALKRLDLKKLATTLGESNLGFASEERLKNCLDLTPGSVSPFGLINDQDREVVFILDNDLLDYEYLGFHPNINTQTVVIKTSDFKKYLEGVGNQILYLDL
jgi:Ala-tRNA(Pro) deacylase